MAADWYWIIIDEAEVNEHQNLELELILIWMDGERSKMMNKWIRYSSEQNYWNSEHHNNLKVKYVLMFLM